jgi:hypothetical protein
MCIEDNQEQRLWRNGRQYGNEVAARGDEDNK